MNNYHYLVFAKRTLSTNDRLQKKKKIEKIALLLPLSGCLLIQQYIAIDRTTIL